MAKDAVGTGSSVPCETLVGVVLVMPARANFYGYMAPNSPYGSMKSMPRRAMTHPQDQLWRLSGAVSKICVGDYLPGPGGYREVRDRAAATD